MRRITCIIDKEHDGATVEVALRELLHMGRAGIVRAKKIEKGITLDGEHAFSIHTVKEGQELGIVISDDVLEPDLCSMEPQEGPVEIVFEDEDVVALNKPAELVVHPGPGHPDQTLSNYLLHYFRSTGKLYNLHPCHRIDLGTSGLILFGTSSYAQDMIQKQLHTTDFQRTYLALCEGHFEEKTGSIEAPLDRLTVHPSTFGIIEGGKYALTHYKVLAEFLHKTNIALSLVELQLETGRTHQIRIHMEGIGHPLLGDITYGAPSTLINRHALHSWKAELAHPITKERLEIKAPLPEDMARLIPKDVLNNL